MTTWLGPTKCDWPNCTSKATFKTPASLNTHTTNIHTTPLICSVPQCSYKKPFGKNYELQRHIETIHGNETPHKCPVKDCEQHASGFSRKDKLKKHMREQHTLLKCPYNHCAAEVVEEETKLHVQQFHGPFECAMASCETGSKSYFTLESALRHLRSCHAMSHDVAYSALQFADSSKDRTIRAPFWVSRDCEVCSTQ
jgi:hypothetical protein